MRWELLSDGDDFSELLNESDEIKKVKSVEVSFDDGVPTGVLVGLKGGHFIHFSSSEVEHDGCRKQLCVSITKEENKNV